MIQVMLPSSKDVGEFSAGDEAFVSSVRGTRYWALQSPS